MGRDPTDCCVSTQEEIKNELIMSYYEISLIVKFNTLTHEFRRWVPLRCA